MRLVGIEIKGIHGIDATVDLDEVREGLVAVAGVNGAGKTTAFEAMLPIPLTLAMISRPGALTDRAPDDRRDSAVVTHTEHDGHLWTSTIKVDPGPTEKSPGTTRAYLSCDGEPVRSTMSGNQREYLDAIRQVFPNPSLLCSSVYSAQDGSGDVLKMSRAERFRIFADLLRLDDDERLAAMGAGTRKDADKVIADVERVADLLQAEADKVAGVADEQTAAKAEAARLAGLAETAAAEHSAARDALATFRAERANVAAAVEAWDTRERTAISRLTAARDAEALAIRAFDQAREAADRLASLRETRANLSTDTIEEATAERRRLVAVHSAGEALLAELKGERSALGDLGDLDSADLATLAEASKVARETVEALPQTSRESIDHQEDRLAAAKSRRDGLAANIRALPPSTSSRLALQAETLARSASLIDGVPCKGEPILDTLTGEALADCSTCPLLTDATTARDDLEGVKYQLADARTADEQRAALDANLFDVRATVEKFEAFLATAREQVRRLDVATQAATVAREAYRSAEANAATHAEREAKLADITTRGKAAQDALATLAADRHRAEGLVDQIREADTAIEVALASSGDTAARKARKDTTEAEALAAAAALTEARRTPRPEAGEDETPHMNREIAKRHESERAAAAHRGAISVEAALGGRLEQLRRREGDLAEAKRRQGLLIARRAAADILATAFGRNGLQAMAIDRAAPRISEIANQLLSKAFAGRFAVDIVTQRPDATNSRMIPTFDIVAIDAKFAARREPRDLSGGERTIVAEALKLAIAVHNAERDGSVSSDLWRDECDGALDAEAAEAYPAILREAMAIGGFDRCFYITHRPDLILQADHVLRVAGGSITIDTD